MVALAVKVRLAEQLAERDPVKAKKILSELEGGARALWRTS